MREPAVHAGVSAGPARSPDTPSGRSEQGGGANRLDRPQALAAPKVELPKGGGAIRGIGEKFAANPVTGTASISVPIAVSPGRSGFGPKLSLSYDSGSGNGPFGFGWTLSIASITHSTDNGLPKYDGHDTYMLSGGEDLVPVYRQDADGSWVAAHAGFARDAKAPHWVRDQQGRLVVHEDELDGYLVRRYAPRIEQTHARIECWTRLASPADVHWRTISADNILSIYGAHLESRISDPADNRRIFTWLLCQSLDTRGNAIIYRYRAEDGAKAPLRHANEAHRGSRDDRGRAAGRHLKRILYGNRTPVLDASGRRPRFVTIAEVDAATTAGDWMFEVVFDYGEHDANVPRPGDAGEWDFRVDPFSSYRAGFEVRNCRICKRALMFHHFSEAPGEVGRDCLVRSTDFTYGDLPADPDLPVYSFMRSATQTGYRREGAGYLSRSMPQLEFEYSEPRVEREVKEVDGASLANLPAGLEANRLTWVDLHGEGLPGILARTADAWRYKPNISPLSRHDGTTTARFAPLETIGTTPNLRATANVEFMDLAGDGRLDAVVLEGSPPGFYQYNHAGGWEPFRPFATAPNVDNGNPNLRFIDLDGDGRPDIMITEADAVVWHPSLGERGFGPARRRAIAVDEAGGPRIVFADKVRSIFLADMSGDGLTDLVRIGRAEVCYWPNLGYGRFGPKVVMDDAPLFDGPDGFDPNRIRLADVDGSGTTDIIYLRGTRAEIYFNQSGNSWSRAHETAPFPHLATDTNVVPIDLLGNGTTCLVWSSPFPADASIPMRYIDLVGGRKPHLLTRIVNNTGTETRIHYAPSTKFYLEDKLAGRPWVTRLPFPVHVVERVVINDHVGRNRHTTRYAYHHGYFDNDDREFRGFGMVENWDTEEFASLTTDDVLPEPSNISADSHIAPMHARTWYHTGIYLGRNHVSDFFAGLLDIKDTGEYFREPGLTDLEARELLLPDSDLPSGLAVDEERQACRALKGSMLRQEVYADDTLPDANEGARARAKVPYTVTERNYAVQVLQPRGTNENGIFGVHGREAISYHYERDWRDPRIEHHLTLEVDRYGNVLKEALVGYGRREMVRAADPLQSPQSNPALMALAPGDRTKQTTPFVTYTERRVTNPIDGLGDHNTPLPAEATAYELTGYARSGPAGRFRRSDFVREVEDAPGRYDHLFTKELSYEESEVGERRRRSVDHVRTLYRSNDLSRLLPLSMLESLAVRGESYSLAFTPGMLASTYKRPRPGQPAESLLPDPVAVLGGTGGDQGGYVSSQALKADGRFPATDPDGHWWIASGRSFFTDNPADSPATELAAALTQFWQPRRFRSPFGHDAFVRYDFANLLLVETRDGLGNVSTVDENDYRVLQPRLLSDPNRNRRAVAYNALGLVVATAVMGKAAPATQEGDSLDGLTLDLSLSEIEDYFVSTTPQANAAALLGGASMRIIHDLHAFQRSRTAHPGDPTKWLPTSTATLTRETHLRSQLPPHGLRILVGFSYADGIGHTIQQKSLAPPAPGSVDPRWLASGWTIFNNKGNPVRTYEPFFSAAPGFEFGVKVGVSSIRFYDPAERNVVTLHPDHSYTKSVFGPWQRRSYDGNDTCAPRNAETGDPRTDPDIGGYVERYFAGVPAMPPWQTWHAQRVGGGLGTREEQAAQRAASHADTPAIEHFDALGRAFLTVARNRIDCPGHTLHGAEQTLETRIEFDIEGNERSRRDARGRLIIRYTYDMLGNRIHHASMEAGQRWMLSDCLGMAIRGWDDRGHVFTTSYDKLRRVSEQRVHGTTEESDPRTTGAEIVIDRIEYGEGIADAESLNLRTNVYRHFDSAGLAINARVDGAGNPVEAYDFKGNLIANARRLLSDYEGLPDWSQQPELEDESFVARTLYDALDRPIQMLSPHSSLPRAGRHVAQVVFNQANQLAEVNVWLGRVNDPDGLIDPAADPPSAVGVSRIDYDAKGQRSRIDYRNGVTTTYRYDPLTFRLRETYTRRGPVFRGRRQSATSPAGHRGARASPA